MRRRSETLLVTTVADEQVPPSPGRADRRGAVDRPARRHRGQHDDAHAGQRLRAGRRVLLHRGTARPARRHRRALLRHGAAIDSAFNVVTVETGGRAPPRPRGSARRLELRDLRHRVDRRARRSARLARPRRRRSPLDVLRGVPERVLGAQGLFATTGAVHAAAAFDAAGEVLDRARGRRSAQRRRQDRRAVGCSTERCRPPASACSSAGGRASSWCRRRGRPASARSSPSSAPTVAGGAHGPPGRSGARRLRSCRPAEHLRPRTAPCDLRLPCQRQTATGACLEVTRCPGDRQIGSSGHRRNVTGRFWT